MCGCPARSYGQSVNLRPPLLDVAIAAAFVAMTSAEAVFSPSVASPVEHLVVAGLGMVALAWRRRAPLVVAALVVASNIAVNPQGEFSTLLSLVLVSSTVGAETRRPRSYAGLALVVVPLLVTSVVHGFEPSDLAAAVVFFVGSWTVASSCAAGSPAQTRRLLAPPGSSASGRRKQPEPRPRSAPGSRASCTTSCPTRSAW
jgi:hypothetical protein